MKRNDDFTRKELDDAILNLNGILTPAILAIKEPMVVWRIIAFNRWVNRFGVDCSA